MQPTNDIRHTINIRNTETNAEIKIRLNDECGNGLETFAITATFWEPGRARVDGNLLHGGCCHDEILQVRPDLKIFVDLHLCDVDGMPIYPIKNGLYLRTKTDKYFKVPAEVCTKLMEPGGRALLVRASEKECTMEEAFLELLLESGITRILKDRAISGVSMLEAMTGKKFEPKGNTTHLEKDKQ